MEKDINKEEGLSQSNRNLIVTIFTISLLIWGPIQPYGMIVRTAYLIALPTVLYLGLGYFGKSWNADNDTNERLNRVIVAMIAGGFIMFAISNFTEKYHWECTEEVQSGYETECVGAYEMVEGSDNGTGFVMIVPGIIAAWYAMAKRND